MLASFDFVRGLMLVYFGFGWCCVLASFDLG